MVDRGNPGTLVENVGVPPRQSEPQDAASGPCRDERH